MITNVNNARIATIVTIRPVAIKIVAERLFSGLGGVMPTVIIKPSTTPCMSPILILPFLLIADLATACVADLAENCHFLLDL